jgi:TPR repeat protein
VGLHPVIEKSTVIPAPPSDPPVPAVSPEQNISTTLPAASGRSPQPVSAAGVEPQQKTADNPHSPPIVTDANQTQLRLARTLLQNDSDPESQAKAVGLLWQAVQKGNATAEIELADLYLQGQVVPKSWSQARVLLTAAQSHKSEWARQKLSDLASYDCE